MKSSTFDRIRTVICGRFVERVRFYVELIAKNRAFVKSPTRVGRIRLLLWAYKTTVGMRSKRAAPCAQSTTYKRTSDRCFGARSARRI